MRLLGRKTKLAKQAKPKTRRKKTMPPMPLPAKETENEKDRCDIAVKLPLDASSMFAGFCSIPAVDSTVRGGNKKQ